MWPVPDGVSHRFEAFRAFWERHRRPRALPVFDVIDAMREIGPLIRNTCLVEVRDDPALIFRVAGGAIHEHTGHELTGKDFLLYTPEEMRATRFAIYRNVVDQPCGMTARHPQANLFGAFGCLYALILPVTRPGYTRPMVLGVWMDDGQVAEVQTDGAEMTVAPEFAYIDIGFGMPNAS
jgi:hypothetical protein